ncbi:4635_t:CDS:2 [Gigaspora margarita]|uniref:4635_t:CDS:1 n=1 Tax=Gigaspora margarita TaxID=4874 RepID=A0ABN7UNA0_GIGMA|nr:4635_t:CDS:2 [Gigaspora margarita]
MRILEPSITLKEHPDVIYRYASKFINTHDIAQQYKERNNKIDIYGSIPVISAEIPVDVTSTLCFILLNRNTVSDVSEVKIKN